MTDPKNSNPDSTNGNKAIGNDPFADFSLPDWREADTVAPETATDSIAPDEESSEPASEPDIEDSPAEPPQEDKPPVEEPPEEPQAVATEERSHFLDDLIAEIDTEMQHAPFIEAMATMDAPQSAEQIDTTTQLQCVVFSLLDTEYAIPIDNVLEISRPPSVTPVPNVPAWLLGVANMRGDILSIVNLRTFLGLPAPTFGATTRLIVAHTTAASTPMSVGLMVDRVREIRYLSTDDLTVPSAPIAEQITPYLQGVSEQANRLLVLLDIDKLLNAPEMRQFEPV